MPIDLDLNTTPYSRYGCWMSVSRTMHNRELGEGLYINEHRGRGLGRTDLFRLDVLSGGEQVEFTESACPTHVTLAAAGGEIDLCIAGKDTLRIRGKGRLGLRLRMAAGVGIVAQPAGEGRWMVNARQNVCRCGFEPIAGRIEVDAPWKPNACEHIVVDLLGGEDGTFDVALDLFFSTWVPPERKTFDEEVAGVASEYEAWLERMPSAPDERAETAELAAYVDFSAVVPPEGLLTRPTMFMSKNHMDQVWSWDHCFNAMAMSYGHPHQAWHQWMVMPDQQDEFGCFPDAVNDVHRHFNYSKPPVHGWSLRFCIDRAAEFFTDDRLAEAYEPLAKWTNWWLTHRVMKGQTLPYYLHGNDSGWDNSTMFDAGAPLVSPDLAAFLTEQTDVLAYLADRLGRADDARHWRQTSDRLLAALLAELWDAERQQFVAVRAADGRRVVCESLVTCMPILLGERLPEEVRSALLERVRTFLTEWGLATERPSSEKYTPDGYWRGPIWAPSTMLIVTGLDRLGETDLARTIAERFARLCAKSGFAENFDALTGAGLRDRAYTWTSSVFLVLAHEYLA